MSETVIHNEALSNKLNYLGETKQQIKEALVYKGQTVNSSDSFRDYVEKIKNIVTGDVILYRSVSEMKNQTGIEEGQIGLVYNGSSLLGIYKYENSEWNLLPTQYTLTNANQLLPGITAYGKSGNVTGNNTFYDNTFDYDGMVHNVYNVDTLDGAQEFYLLEKLESKSYSPVKIIEDTLFNIDTSTYNPVIVKDTVIDFVAEETLTPLTSNINQAYGAGADNCWFYKMYANDMRMIYYRDAEVEIVKFINCAHTGTNKQLDELFRYNGDLYLARPAGTTLEILKLNTETYLFEVVKTINVSDIAFIIGVVGTQIYYLNYTSSIAEFQVYCYDIALDTVSDILCYGQSYAFPSFGGFNKFVLWDYTYFTIGETQKTNNSDYGGGQNDKYSTHIFMIHDGNFTPYTVQTDFVPRTNFVYDDYIYGKNNDGSEYLKEIDKYVILSDGTTYKKFYQKNLGRYGFEVSSTVLQPIGLPAVNNMYGQTIYKKPTSLYELITYGKNKAKFNLESLTLTTDVFNTNYEVIAFKDHFVVIKYNEFKITSIKLGFYKEIPINDASVGYVLIDGQAFKEDPATGLNQYVYYNMAPASISEDDYRDSVLLTNKILGITG